MSGKLKKGKWYWNTSERLLYKVEEVVEVDGDDWLAVCLDDGSTDTWNARALAAVSAPASPPWWERPFTPGIAERLCASGVDHLYHFTSLYNLKRIREVGAICSKRTLGLLERWPVPVPGGDGDSHRRDRELGDWGRVALSFARHMPLYRKRRMKYPLAVFCLSPEIAGADGVVITDTNTASSDHQRFCGLDKALPHLDFRSFRPSPRSDTQRREARKRAVQAEILVPERVPLRFNEKIIVETREHAHFVDEVFGPISEVETVNDPPSPQLFWDPDEPPPWEPVGD